MAPNADATRRTACPQPRISIILLSLILLAAAGGHSGLSFYALVEYRSAIDSTAARVFLGIMAVHMGLVCLSAFAGILSAAAKRSTAVNTYSTGLYTLWIAMLAFGIAEFILLWRDRDEFRHQCPVQLKLTHQQCQARFTFFYGLTMALWIIAVLVASTLVSLARDFAKQLVQQV